MKINSRVALAGGLGNQLFQYAYSILKLDNRSTSVLECVGFKVGAADAQMPDIAYFHLPKSQVHKCRWSKNKLEQICFNYLLRNSSYQKIIRMSDPVAVFARMVVSLCKRYQSKTEEHAKCRREYSGNPKLEIGYFQDKIYPEKVISIMRGMTLLNPSEVVNFHIKLAETEKPLIVHIRLGDYAQNPNFGILSQDYYHKAIQEEFNLSKYGKIWLFSDDVQVALDILGSELLPLVRAIDSNIGTSETFEIMRLGDGYIIGNSSFSFWAAMLRKNQNTLVCAPSPWFKTARYSEGMFPSNWSFRQAHFHSY